MKKTLFFLAFAMISTVGISQDFTTPHIGRTASDYLIKSRNTQMTAYTFAGTGVAIGAILWNNSEHPRDRLYAGILGGGFVATGVVLQIIATNYVGKAGLEMKRGNFTMKVTPVRQSLSLRF